MSEVEDDKIFNLFEFDLRNVQKSNIKLLIFCFIFLYLGIYTKNNILRNIMIKGIFIVLFIQILDFYTFRRNVKFLKHEKYLLSLSTLVGEGIYHLFILPKLR